MPHELGTEHGESPQRRVSYDAYMPHLLICTAIRDGESWPDRWLTWLKLHVIECRLRVWVPGLDSFPPVSTIL